MRQLLAPFDQTAFLCRMTYLAPFVVHGALRLDGHGELDAAERQYRALLVALRDGTLDLGRATEGSRINDLVEDA
jgi:glutathione-regulated potassium-efflux system ancillary protein KefG